MTQSNSPSAVASPSKPWRTLPSQPNLEQLKKQAKDLLRDYIAGDADAIAEVKRAERSPDPTTFALADAQRVLARAYGFASWTLLKQRVEGITVSAFCDAARRGDVARLHEMLRVRRDLVHIDLEGSNEQRALHVAVLNRQAEAVRVLMEAGSDARKGVYPNRDATTPLIIAQDRGYDEIVAIIEQAEQHRREEASCPNVTVSPAQDRINAAIKAGRDDEAIAALSADETLIKACDREGASPLHVAAEAGNAAIVRWLLAKSASRVKEDLKGRTPLDRAVFAVNPRNKGSLERFATVAALLRNAGAPLTLPAAIALGDAEAVQRFHQERPALFAPGTLQIGPLGIAVRHRQYAMLRLLIKLGVDVDDRRRLPEYEDEQYTAGDPLWHAALAGDLEAATILLDAGADPNAMLHASGTPTTTASDPRMQKMLMDRGGKLMSTSVGTGRHVDLARRLLAGHDLHLILPDTHPGANLPEQLLWGAACGGSPEIVAMALEHIDWKPDDSRWFYQAIQPLRIHNHGPGFWATPEAPRNYTECFRLIMARIDPNLRSGRGETLLHRTASDGTTWGHEVITQQERLAFATMLLDAGARFDARDDLLLSTPLAWAARWGRTELVQLLVDRGAPAHEPDAERWATPLAWAERYKRHDIIQILRGRLDVAAR